MISTLVGLNFSSAFAQTERKSSEEFFRANSARSATEDKLTEILRKKQAELDAKENAARGVKTPVTPAVVSPAPAAVEPVLPKPAAAPVAVAPTAVAPSAISSTSQDQLEELLRRKQAELNDRENIVRPARPVQPGAPAAQPVVIEPRPARPVTPIPAPAPAPAVNSTIEDRLTEALRKKQAELDANEQVAAPRAAQVVETARQTELSKAEARKAAAAAKEREESDKHVQKIEAEIKAKEEAIKKRAATQSAPANVSTEKSNAVNAAVQSNSKPSKKPTPVVPVPDASTKEGRLADLLRRYKADEITPHDYHLERAKIIAEP
ncbi:MAG: hypothetical protein ABIV39_05805 [Verrucomicrobiota bacterium]